MNDCVFCKIISKEIPSQIETENDDIIVFSSNQPKASLHLLIVPKKHLDDLRSDVDGLIWNKAREMAIKIAEEKGLSGFRITTNVGDAAAVKHMHVHLLGEVGQEREI